MIILIDSNIYLNFYRLKNNQSLELIDQLIKLIKDKKIELILPQQVQDEFYRNKSAVFKEYLNSLASTFGKDLRVPKFIESNRESKKLIKLLGEAKKTFKKFEKECSNRVFNPKSKINKKIESLFKLSTLEKETENVLKAAYYRTLKGNPPRKNNKSFGDAIIWETVLENFCEKDLNIISGDGDFESNFRAGQIDEFLFREFFNVHNKNVKLYTNLSEFINTTRRRRTIEKAIVTEEKEISALSLMKNSIFLSKNKDDSSIFSSSALSAPLTLSKQKNNQIETLTEGIALSTPLDISGQINNRVGILGQEIFSSNSLSIGPEKKCQVCGGKYKDNNFSFFNVCSKCNSSAWGGSSVKNIS